LPQHPASDFPFQKSTELPLSAIYTFISDTHPKRKCRRRGKKKSERRKRNKQESNESKKSHSEFLIKNIVVTMIWRKNKNQDKI
jgi:hypothetical protein